MGLYIKDIVLPEDPNEIIEFAVKGDGALYVIGEHYWPDAIEVPEPHGRLVDADEMFVEFVTEGQRSKRYKLGEKWELNGEEIRNVISKLPTIIPASEED